ncbi:MAG: hypothetical protein KDB03_26115 [Planctomycetales bacterium]|nr:hypothetical protein [Planctomycetales bacterium]
MDTLPSWVLSIVRCPTTKLPLRPANETTLEQLREEQQQGRLQTLQGEFVSRPICGLLINEASTLAYRIDDGRIDLQATTAIRILHPVAVRQ